MAGAPSSIDRRSLLGLAGGLALVAIGCSDADEESSSASAFASADAGALVLLYDTYAQALYLDGTYGPTTGVIRAVDMGVGADKRYDFWHGHGGIRHRFTVTAAHFAELRRKTRVSITTTIVEGHQHTLFIDPVDPRWRVPGATPISV